MAEKVQNTYATIFTTFIPATLCLSLRLYSRWLRSMDFWIDDYLAIVAWVSAVTWNSLLIAWISHGFGRHIDSLPVDKSITLYFSRLLNWNLDLQYALCLGSSKLSILALYWRLFKLTKIRVPIICFATLSLLWIISRLILSLTLCVPINGLWDANVEAACNIKPRDFFFYSTMPHVLLDFFILCLPVWPIKDLNLGLLQKFGLLLTFMFGILVVTASMIVLAPAFRYTENSDDITWNNVNMFLWATVEINLAIVAGSFPMLRGAITPLLTKVSSRTPQDRRSNTSTGRGDGGHSLVTFGRLQVRGTQSTTVLAAPGSNEWCHAEDPSSLSRKDSTSDLGVGEYQQMDSTDQERPSATPKHTLAA